MMAYDALRLLVAIVLLNVRCSGTQNTCVPIRPPEHGVIRCEHVGKQLICTARCNEGFVFTTRQAVIKRVCDDDKGIWSMDSPVPECLRSYLNGNDTCGESLVFDSIPAWHFTSSSVWTGDCGNFGPERARLSAAPSSFNNQHLSGGWRPQNDDINQYLQIKLKNSSRIVGIVTKGLQSRDESTENNYVTVFRVLHSNDGIRFYPYANEYVYDKFFSGNNDTNTPVVTMLTCPFEARYVRINPLKWHGHIGLRFDLIGCEIGTDDVTTFETSTTRTTTIKQQPPTDTTICEPVVPPINGVVNCEKTSNALVCTAVCKDGFRFIDKSRPPFIKNVCNIVRNSWLTRKDYPPCVVKPSETTFLATDNPLNRNCISEQSDCQTFGNGDFHACLDCHYFASCSEGTVYFRPCPDNLVFDSTIKQCQYSSRTCPALSLVG